MIIGTAEGLANLGQQLQSAQHFAHEPGPNGWPAQVAVVNAESPFADRPEYRVSFHIQIAPLPSSLQVRSRSGPSVPVFVTVLALALVGSVSLLRWVWSAL
jgi:hypothetical protein